MVYITAREAAQNWDMSIRYVHFLCQNAAIPGALLAGRQYLIPANTQKPTICDRGRFPASDTQLEPISETAARQGVSPRWMLEMIHSGKVDGAVKIGRNYFLPAGYLA